MHLERLSRWVAVIPAKDEAERVESCVLAIASAARMSSLPVSVFVLANNSTDRTHEIVLDLAPTLHEIELSCQTITLPPQLAHAGGARRTAVDRALSRYAPDKRSSLLLFSTDADSRVQPDFFVKLERAYSNGADVVLAELNIVSDPLAPISEAALAWDHERSIWRSRVRTYLEILRTHRVPPRPLHDDYGGSGITLRVAAYDTLGGFQPVPFNEDKNLVAAADRTGMIVNRNSGAMIDVSGRALGRATGGMAQELLNCEAAVAEGRPCLVEHHVSTLARIRANPVHANAFVEAPTNLEAVSDAIAAFDRELALLAKQLAREPAVGALS